MPLRVIAGLLVAGLCLAGCASAGGARPSPFPTPATPSGVYPEPLPADVHSFSTAAFLNAARGFTGVKYQLGGASPRTGFDCSGYVQYVFGLYRIPVPRTVGEQYRAGRAVSGLIKPGDLLFFRTNGPKAGITHVALALGPDEFIHAPAESGVVRIEHLSAPYWRARYAGARRIL